MGLHSRTDYQKGELHLEDVAKNPWSLFESWVEEAVAAGISDPTAFTLSTVDEEGCPHGRIVLLRDTRNEELVFYTNYRSEKGEDLERLGKAGATFFWPHAERQVRVRGKVSKVSAEESDVYFASRPRASQLGAWSSAQSSDIGSREHLDQQFETAKKRFDGLDVPRPSHWGGFSLRPDAIEIWQGRPSRMHDRFRCQRSSEGWKVVRLQP